jgi:hypothetical protein
MRDSPALDQFDAVAVGVLDEGDHGAAVLHRPGLAHHLAAAALDPGAGGVGIVDLDRDVAEAGAEVVAFRAPVVGELDHGAFGFRAVADEGEGEPAVRIILPAQQAHAEYFGVEPERALEVTDPEHGVQYAHRGRV